MASETLALNVAAPGSQSISDRLHDWAITVDHKRLGILYILYALVFLVIGGVEATIMRIQLVAPHNRLCFTAKSSTACSPCTEQQ